MPKTPSPCISVCKFKRVDPAGYHRIGCSMTKAQKKIVGTLRKVARWADICIGDWPILSGV